MAETCIFEAHASKNENCILSYNLVI